MEVERARWRVRISELVDGRAGRWSNRFDATILTLIVVSIVQIALETLTSLTPAERDILSVIEHVCTAAFSVEYIVRLLAAERWTKYAFSFFGLVDLIAILPSLLALGFDLRGVRSIRLFRVFRVLKLVRYQRAVIVYRDAFYMVREEIVLFLMTTLVLLFLAATGIFYFEHDAQPDKFQSIPHALWWAVCTITTVGYGDVFPITAGGRIFTFFVLVIGVGLVAVPSGLMASSISQARKQLKLSEEAAEPKHEEPRPSITREQWGRHVVLKWPWLFALAERFTTHGIKLLLGADIRGKDALQLMRALLFIRILAGTEAIARMARDGFMTEADVLYRSNLEALFRLAALVESPDLLIPYMGEDFPRRRQAMNDIKSLLSLSDPRPVGAVTDDELDAAIQEIDQELQAFLKTSGLAKVRELRTWDWVVAGKQFDFFWGKYLMHSNAAHHAARDLERRIRVAPDGGQVKSLSVGIEDDPPPVGVILEALLLLSRAVEFFARAHDAPIPQELVDAKASLDERFAEESLKGGFRSC